MKEFLVWFMVVKVIFLPSCKVGKPVIMPELKTMPDHFIVQGDSSGISRIPWKQYFHDQYLNSLIDSTLRNNPDLLIALQRIDIANAQLAMRKGAFFPNVNGVVSAGIDKYGNYTMNGVGNFDTNLSPNIDKDQKIPFPVTPDFFIGFRSTWEIDIWGKLRNQKNAAMAQWMATQKGRQYAITSLVAEVAKNYYELLSLEDELHIIQKNIALQETALEVVRVQKEGGRATELAVKQFSAQLLNTKAIEFQLRQQVVEIENHLNAISGRYAQPILRDTSIMYQPLPEFLNTGFPSDMLVRRPDIQQAEFELMTAKENVLAARKAFLPSLTLSPYIGLNSFKLPLIFNPSSIAYGALAGLTAPIFNQRQIAAGYSIANAQNKEAVYQYQKMLFNSFNEVLTHLKSIDNNTSSFHFKEQEVKELSAAVATARDLYLTGYANYLEVITAQKGVLEAELELVGNKKRLFHSVIHLYRSLGGGWE